MSSFVRGYRFALKLNKVSEHELEHLLRVIAEGRQKFEESENLEMVFFCLSVFKTVLEKLEEKRNLEASASETLAG